MNVDFSKRLCDATLGEYLAAERSVGIVTGWIMAIGTAAVLLLARWGRKVWLRRRAPVAAIAGAAGISGGGVHVAWYYGDTGSCRRCGASNIGAGHLDRCPACAFGGGRP